MVSKSGTWEVLVDWTWELMEGRDLDVSSSQVGEPGDRGPGRGRWDLAALTIHLQHMQE